MTKWLPTIFALIGWTIADSAIAGEVDYLTQVKPLLAAKCYSCHGALKQQAELRLETGALMLIGGDSGQAIVPGNADDSRIVARISADEDQRMPPQDQGSPLTADEIALIRKWIDEGAEAPDEATPTDPRKHWAFQKPVRPEVPHVQNSAWSRNPIDALLAAGHERQGLVPLDVAEKHVLLRRLYLDLIGLPPTREELHKFLADDSEDAYDKVVTHLLKHPGYGERWGRHWMDVWRYSDWYGLGEQVRYSQKHIWRWRDWIIESLNEDKPYDRMIVEMLAADEIAPSDPDAVRATGFLARNYFLFNRTTWLDSTVEHTSKALLGLTLNCARCHDHKYDPLLQTDYYQMRAIFEPHQVRVDPIPGEADLDRDGLPRAFDTEPDTPTYLFVGGNEKTPDMSRVIVPGIPSVLSEVEFAPRPITLPMEAYAPGLQSFALADHLAVAEEKIAAARTAVNTSKQQLRAAERVAASNCLSQNPTDARNDTKSDKPQTAVDVARAGLIAAEKSLVATELHPPALRSAFAADLAKANESDGIADLVREAAIAARRYEFAQAEQAVAQAEHDVVVASRDKKAEADKNVASSRTQRDQAAKKLEEPGDSYTSLYVSKRAANGMVDEATPRHGPYAKVSTGRRTALARWIASRDNPLTARVAVNHIWLRHLGQPLVASMTDFGLRTKQPPQNELLDWLAVELMEHGWSMKHLHRLIVTSHAYQLRSSLLAAEKSTRQVDPDNDYYWRRKPLRMESQVLRDSLLHLAGVLDAKLGGPTVPPANEDSVFRRSLYFTHSRDDRAKFVSMFDDADIIRCYRRKESIVPQQALALANSKLALTMSRKIAAELSMKLGETSNDQFIAAVFETILMAPPTAEESAACLAAIKQTVATLENREYASPQTRARENLVHALLNHNDFVTIR
jgi:hypothetical protein